MKRAFVFGQFVSVLFFKSVIQVCRIFLSPRLSPALGDNLFAVSGAVCTCTRAVTTRGDGGRRVARDVGWRGTPSPREAEEWSSLSTHPGGGGGHEHGGRGSRDLFSEERRLRARPKGVWMSDAQVRAGTSKGRDGEGVGGLAGVSKRRLFRANEAWIAAARGEGSPRADVGRGEAA